MVQSCFDKVTQLFQSVHLLVIAANRLAKAYARGVKHPEYYKSFGGGDPELVAINLAGLFAADTAANILAALSHERFTLEEAYIAALHRLAAMDLSDGERYIVMNLANLSWRTSQAFRDMKTAVPLNRLTQAINQQFNTLNPEEEEKDIVQIQEGAKILLEHIGI